MGEPVTFDDLAEALSAGLDLCVRARKLDELTMKAIAAGTANEHGTRCGTPALWVVEQYERDVAAWEVRAKALLSRLPQFSIPTTQLGAKGHP